MRYSLAPVLFTCLLLCSCAYPEKSALYSARPTAPQKADLYIYRTDTAIDSGNPDVPRIYVNGTFIGKLMVGGHYLVSIDPGTVKVAFRDSLFGIPFFWDTRALQLEVAANQKYFVKFAIESIFRMLSFEAVPKEQGESEIRSTHLLIP